MGNPFICGAAAAAVLLALPAAHAQNKCVDANGKIVYQQGPCPGTVRAAPAPAPAKPAAPSAPASTAAPAAPPRSAAPQPAPTPPPPVSGASSKVLSDEYAEMERCAGDWEAQAGALERSRENIARLRAQGRDTSRIEAQDQQRSQSWAVRSMPACGKYGFEAPRDPAAEQRNSAVARDLKSKMTAKRAEIDAATSREQEQREAPARALREAQQLASRDKECTGAAARRLAEARAMRSQVPAAQLARFDQDLANVERDIKARCPGR